MRRRDSAERPPLPDWLADGRLVDAEKLRAWAAENGWTVLDILREQMAHHRRKWNLPDDAPA